MKKESLPLVSVIIACYNAEQYIDMCLNSLKNQTYQNFEIIICDDCSTDHSYSKLLEWQSKDDRIILLKNEKNLYAAATRNHCFSVAHGDYYMIQDIDDASEPNRIESLLSGIMSESVDFVSSAVRMFKGNLNNIVGRTNIKKTHPSKNDFLWSVSFFHPATLFSANCIKAVDGYRVAKETRRMEDYDLFMRLYANGFHGANVRDELYLYRKDADQLKRSIGFANMIEEIKVKWGGYKKLHILWYGWPFLIKPFLAYIKRLLKYHLSSS